VDIGGTFTDVVLYASDGRMHVVKTLTTPADPSQGMIEGITQVLHETRTPPERLTLIVHGTTLVTNAILERKGVTTGLLTTKGFRDVLEIGREMRHDLYDLFLEKPAPLVPRPLRLEVGERVLASGDVAVPLDTVELREQAERLRALGVTSVVIGFLHSYVNPQHEREAVNALQAMNSDWDVTSSSDVAPVIREYERFSTAVANGYVKPLVRRYLSRIEAALRARRCHGQVLLMASNGGAVDIEEACARPVFLTESGPAAGAVAAAHFARRQRMNRIVSFDMGGTTAKICLVDGGAPMTTTSFEAARLQRFKRGSGLPLRIPVIDMIEIGAGGGSIASVDAMGLLKVGPESAGAQPGPACYGQGGRLPTVTDADLLLGYLDPAYFLGGRKALDQSAALEAVRRVAEPLGIDPLAAAVGIVDVVNGQMATAARVHGAETGRDVRAYVLYAFGGAGPVHAYAVSRALGVRMFICPPASGVASAVGLLIAPVMMERSVSYVSRLEAVSWSRVHQILEQLKTEVKMVRDLSPAGTIRYQYAAEMRYVGQGYELRVPLRDTDVERGDIAAIRAVFEREYQRLYGQIMRKTEVEVVSWYLTATGEQPARSDWTLGQGDAGAPARAARTRRSIYFAERRGFVDTPVFDRYALRPGARIAGPAAIEERESTTIVGPGGRVVVDEALNLRVTVGAPGGRRQRAAE
jgi:N-methylhydantoinase A